MLSLPAPLVILSLPAPPMSVSSPVAPASVSLPAPPVMLSLPVPPLIVKVPSVSALPMNVSTPELAAFVSVNVELDATRISFVVIVTAVFVLASVMVSIFLMLSKSLDVVNAVFPVKATVSVPELPSTTSELVKPVAAANVKVSLPVPPVIVSLPWPAVMALFPAPPSMMSLPAPPGQSGLNYSNNAE